MDVFIFISIFLALTNSATVFLVYRMMSKQVLPNNTDDHINAEKQELEQDAESIKLHLEIYQKELEEKHNIELQKLKISLQSEFQTKQLELTNTSRELQSKFDKKEEQYEIKLQKLESEREKIESLKDELRTIKQDLLDKRATLDTSLLEHRDTIKNRLEELAGLTQLEAKNTLFAKVQEQTGVDLLEWQQKYLEKVEDEASITARTIVAQAVQRCSSEVANEYTLTTIKLNDDDQKGKIIGKGGRNIQWLEKTLGVELVIDDTPEIITISGFSSIRRHIAKRTIELLLEDGRIHPASIEEMQEKAKAEMAQEIADSGQWAMNELGIYDFPAKLVRLIGRLKFRTSYGQNMLHHSVEMAKLAALLAHELNAAFPNRTNPIDVDICIKGALLHDIGKGIDEESQPRISHVTLGEKICDTFNLDWRIKKCISSHHNESYTHPEHGFCVEAVVVDACDNISGSRIGARKETAQAYFERMEALEKIARDTPGVQNSWIMRGSRELWVFFDTESISASRMQQSTREIAERIQTDVKYPGEIKIIGFWEDRVVEYAH